MTTVANIVIAEPAAARVFERYAIDYCCHGQRSLEQACADAGVDVAAVQAELSTLAVGTTPSAVANEVGVLIGHIVATHHTYLRRELPRLGELMAKVIAAHGAHHPALHDVAATLVELADDLLPHLAKEEKVLFPLAIELLGAVEATTFHCGSVMNPIRVMHLEHDRVGALLATLRRQTGGYQPPADACPTWRALYAGFAEMEADVHQHVHLENNVLFPKVISLEMALA
ncbi:MAG: iron-sulfur cluster repair di-iron protein [Ilumatobacteraceae bacterium]